MLSMKQTAIGIVILVTILILLLIGACAPMITPVPTTVAPVAGDTQSGTLPKVSGSNCKIIDSGLGVYRCEDAENYIYIHSSSLYVVSKGQ
jgi:hypothetical protein